MKIRNQGQLSPFKKRAIFDYKTFSITEELSWVIERLNGILLKNLNTNCRREFFHVNLVNQIYNVYSP